MRKLLILFMGIFILTNPISAACEEGQIDVNSATLEELDEIYGIGPAKGQAIIDARPYETLDDLTNSYGIGEATLNRIKSQGLACVEGGDEESEKSDESDLDEIVVEIVEEKKEQPLKTNPETKTVELKVITLGDDSKGIKTDNVSELQEKERGYAVYGFVAFSILLAFLFGVKAWKNKYKYKNEFDKTLD